MPNTLTPALRESASWLINAGIDDTQRRLADMSGSSEDLLILRTAIAAEKAKPQLSQRPSRLNPIEAKLRKFERAGPSAAATAIIPPPKPAAILASAKTALESLRAALIAEEEIFLTATLPQRLKMGLHCLKAYVIFAIKDPKKIGALKGKKSVSRRDTLIDQGFEGWLAIQCSWLKRPTAYKYMTALKGLGLSESATEEDVDDAVRQTLRIGPTSLKALCDAAVEAVAPTAPPAQTLRQSEFQFLVDGLKDFREQAEHICALKTQLQGNPDMLRVACARAYSILFELTGTNWTPSDEPDALALVDPDSIAL